MKDIQNSPDSRNIAIDRVGVKDLVMPLMVQQQDKLLQQVTARIDIFVNLSSKKKATHMSRFVEIIEDFRNTPISISMTNDILHAMQQRLETKIAYLDISFTYFMEKIAPISQKRSLLNYQCGLSSTINGNKSDHVMKVRVPISLLCPCSKEISKYGAHNQRGVVSAEIYVDTPMLFAELIALLEPKGSGEIYSLLKRVDEKFITEKTYENPKFVEDIVRDAALKLEHCTKILAFKVSCESYESIHNHSAFAEVVKGEKIK